MEEVSKKFNNFKNLCNEIDSSNSWIVWLNESVDLTTFLLGIKSKSNLSHNELYNEMLIATELKHEVIEPFSEKLKKYFEYFKLISNII